MVFIEYMLSGVRKVLVWASILNFGCGLLSAQAKAVDAWKQELLRLQRGGDIELAAARASMERIRRGIELWIRLHPESHIPLEPGPLEAGDAAAMRAQVSSMIQTVDLILRLEGRQPFQLQPTTLHVQGSFPEEDFAGPMFTESYTRTEVTEKGMRALGPASSMSVPRALSLIPSVNQQSVDPAGLADSSNYHESFRFRGVEATGGGNPATPVNVENIPVSGRPGGGANIYDLENFKRLSIFKGGAPAGKAFGLTNIGGKIDLEVKRPDEKVRLDGKQAFGSYGFQRSFLRLSTGLFPSKTAGFLSFSDTHAGKWKGKGDSARRNAMLALTQKIGQGAKVEFFSIYSRTRTHLYRPLDYEKAASLRQNYRVDYVNDKADYYYYGYNQNSFTDYSIFGVVDFHPDARSRVTVKPFYWRDTGYHWETIKTNDGNSRIRRWDIDHGLQGVQTQYSRKMQGAEVDAGYSYLDQERPGPPTSWKLYKMSDTGLVFDKWQVLSASSKHRQHVAFVSGRYSTGPVNMEGGVKYLRYSMPEIITFNPVGVSDVGYREALSKAASIDLNSSAPSLSFSTLLPNFGISFLMNKSLSSYFSYGRNHGMSVNRYPFFISQKNSFQAKGITLRSLWEDQKLEIADNVDAGLRYISRKLYVTPTLYYARHRNKTATYYDASLKAVFPSSMFKADAYGFELEAGSVPVKNLSVYSSFSYNRFYFSQNIHSPAGSVLAVSGNQVPDAPEFLVKAILSYSVGGFILSPVVRYTSGRYGDILQTEKIGGAAVFDVDFTYAAAMPQIKARSLDITLAFSNVLNSKYVSILNTSDYTTLGSTYQMGAPFTVQGAISLSF